MRGRIFINYRRGDSSPTAGRLRDHLVQAFGEDNVFMDIESIPAGVDFVDYLKSQIASYDIVLVLIGPDWLQAKDETGRRRLENPDDPVTMEITTALDRKGKVVPVTIDGARMPTAEELPDPIKALARRNAVDVRNTHFRSDVDSLIEKIDVRKWWSSRPLKVAGAVTLIALAAAIGLYLWSEPTPVQPTPPLPPPGTQQKTTVVPPPPPPPGPSQKTTVEVPPSPPPGTQQKTTVVPPPPPPPVNPIAKFTTQQNRDIYGQDITLPDGQIYISGVDLNTCAAKCDDEKLCVAFSFDHWNHKCFLKNNIVTSLLDPHSIIAVKKPNKLPDMSNVPTKMAVRLNHRYFGQPQASKRVANVEACKAACTVDDKCVAFSFLKNVGAAENCQIFYVSEDAYLDDPSADSGFKYQE